MRSSTRILIAAGGSGGHIFPAVALARSLKEKQSDIEIKFIGSSKDLDRRVFEREGLSYSLLSANKLPYKFSFGLVIFFVKLLFDITKTFIIFISFRPKIVVGFGGYISSPVILAAWFLRIPSIVHEQNVAPGRANKFIFALADKIAISFEETKKFLGPRNSAKAVFTGNPIRATLFKDNKSESLKRFGFDMNKFTLLVIGGSQGAHFLNETFIKSLEGLDGKTRSGLQIIHITGIKDYGWARNAYGDLKIAHQVYSFIDDIEEAYSASDLVVTRSGASAIFEIALFGRAMLLVPYPFAHAHQSENAKIFSQRGAAIEISEDHLSAGIFKNEILGLLNDRVRLGRMAQSAKNLAKPDSSDILAGEVLKSVGV